MSNVCLLAHTLSFSTRSVSLSLSLSLLVRAFVSFDWCNVALAELPLSCRTWSEGSDLLFAAVAASWLATRLPEGSQRRQQEASTIVNIIHESFRYASRSFRVASVCECLSVWVLERASARVSWCVKLMKLSKDLIATNVRVLECSSLDEVNLAHSTDPTALANLLPWANQRIARLALINVNLLPIRSEASGINANCKYLFNDLFFGRKPNVRQLREPVQVRSHGTCHRAEGKCWTDRRLNYIKHI